MEVEFESKTIPETHININGDIKKVKDKYKKRHVEFQVLLSHFLAVKSRFDDLAEAENPWAYYYKGIEGYDVESGVSVDETLFTFGAMKLKDQKPSDVINATFYANKIRNDYDFELGYLLPIFFSVVNSSDRILIINPSPTMIVEIENNDYSGKHYYIVPDRTVAKLYKIEFPETDFYVFEDIDSIKDIDVILITSRDQKTDMAQTMLNCLKCCKDSAKVLGLIPTTWFESSNIGTKTLIEAGFGIEKLLIIPSEMTLSKPKKKILVLLNKTCNSNMEMKRARYDHKTRFFEVYEQTAYVDYEKYLKSGKTILSFWNAFFNPIEDKREPKYNSAYEYSFSKEISLFYRIYSGRKSKYAGVAYYKEIKNIELHTFGKKKTKDVEKGLRADSREGVISALERMVFDDAIYMTIRADIEKNYIDDEKPVTLKTLWFYCWIYLTEIKKYDHDYMCQIFENDSLADIIPQNVSGNNILKVVSESLNIDMDSIPFKCIEQLDIILKSAQKRKLILFDPLESFVAEYSSRATERQQDVRNALVKKHFSENEEKRLFEVIAGSKMVDGTKILLCAQRSLFLAPAIRLFTGMAIREVAALKWSDYKIIDGTDDHQMVISKFVDNNGKIILHAEKDNWKRFRLVPVAKSLSYLLEERKRYLLSNGIDEEYLMDCPIVLREERLADMKAQRKLSHCKPSAISAISNEIIKEIGIPENEIILPDAKNDMTTDFNKYHGDIFLSNFRHKANHIAKLTMGELNYIIGIDAPDTFSRHYCDYTNDFVQIGIIQKLCRWELSYERMVAGKRVKKPSHGEKKGNMSITTGPYKNGVASVDMIVENRSSEDIEVVINSAHGMDVNTTSY